MRAGGLNRSKGLNSKIGCVLDIDFRKADVVADQYFMDRSAYGHRCQRKADAHWHLDGWDFDGTGDYVDVTDLTTDLSGDGDFTADVLIKSASQTNIMHILSQSHTVDPYASDWIFGGSILGEALWMRSVTIAQPSGFDGRIWHYLAMAWDKSAGTYKGYLDSNALGVSGSVAGYGGVSSVKVGSRGDGTLSFYNGKIGKVRLYNLAEYAARILQRAIRSRN